MKRLFAYTTVMTVMDNLYKKGFVTRRKVKKTYHYAPIAPENVFIRSAMLGIFSGLISEYGKLRVFSSFIAVEVALPNLGLNQKFALYKTPVTGGFLTSFIVGLFGISLWDLAQDISFFDSADYVKLVLSEPKIIFDHTHLFFSAFLESLPIVSLLTSVLLFIFAIFIIRKITKLLHFKFPLFFRTGGLV